MAQSGSLAVAGDRERELTIPAHSNPAARTIEIGLAPSLAGSHAGRARLPDRRIPYGCTEQTLSAFLPNLVVARTLAQLKLTPTERLSLLDRQVTAGVTRLLDYQHEDGGWGWWKTDENHPFMTAYALYGLLETRANGYQVADWKIRKGLGALAKLYREYPRAVPALKAYMLFVFARAAAAGLTPETSGGPAFDRAAALTEVWARRDDLTAYGRALLLLTLDAAERRARRRAGDGAGGRGQTTGGLAWWTIDHDPLLEDWADTSVEATATAVQALAARNPGAPVLEAAVRYLLANRQSGAYWASTKQTAMALYGLTAFMKARGEQPSAFAVDVAVNGTAVKTVSFDAASLTAPDPVLVTAPGREGDNVVTLTKRGGGALYWSAAARYFDTRTPHRAHRGPPARDRARVFHADLPTP